MADEDDKGLKGDEKILAEAKRRFQTCSDWEAPARAHFIEDVKFAEGDSENKWQWDNTVYDARIGAKKPALTVNKTREHNLQILNDQRQNKSQIKIRPVGGDATFKSAQIYEGIVRHIEYQSRALEAYDAGAYNQIYGGWGYWRLTTDYADADSFDQEIFIKRVRDPLSIYLDPDIQEFDGSDARFGFAFEDMSRERYETDYPDDKDETGGRGTAMDWGTDGWWDKDSVRVAEYFRKSEKADTLLLLDDQTKVLKSEIPKEYLSDKGKEGSFVWNGQGWVTIQKAREVTNPKVEWFKIAGNKIIDRNVWPGSYIPIVRVIGEETIIDGQLDRKGHTRALKDPQRMYNYYSSAAVEYAAGQTKTPYMGPAAAFEGQEVYWNDANLETRPYLPYNHVDDEGRDIPQPTKINPPVSHSAAMEGMKVAQMEMMMASGQYQSQFGENENAKSGIAIQTRQRQGDNATYHFIDHLAQAITFTGRQLIDLIPKVYDTPRAIKIMAEDGTQTEVNLEPNGPAYEQRVNGQPATEEEVKSADADPNLRDSIETIFNPNVGKYDVEADIGPAFATRRQESFAAGMDLIKQNQAAFGIFGDLIIGNGDWPNADAMAERIKRSIPPQLLGEGVPPQVQQLQEQFKVEVGHLHEVISKLIQANAEKDMKLKDSSDKNNVAVYDAETRRMSAVGAIDPEALKPVVRQLVSEALGTPVVPLMAAHAHAEQAFMPEDPAAEQQEQQPQQAAE